MKIIYTGYFVDDIRKLLDEVPVTLQGDDVKIYAHHITKDFKPSSGLNGVKPGATRTVYGFAEVITDRVQTLLVRGEGAISLSTNPHPHITIATAAGALPVESNVAIEQAYKNSSVKILPKEIEIKVTEGYFDGESVRKVAE